MQLPRVFVVHEAWEPQTMAKTIGPPSEKSAVLGATALRAVFDAAPDATVLVDEHGRIVAANAQVEQLFGYTRRELLGQLVETLLPERLRAVHRKHRASYDGQRAARPMPPRLNLMARRADGREFPVDIGLSPVETPDGTLVAAAVRDITEQVSAEAAVRRSEELYRLLAEHAQDIIYRVRTEPGPPHLEYVSPACTRLTGYTPEEHYADPELMSRMCHPDDRELLAQLLTQPQTLLDPPTIRFRTSDGQWRWHEQRVTPVFDDSGTLVAIEGIARDVTERVEAEEERRLLEVAAELQNERQRIARDLHDGVIGSLYGVGLSLQGVAHDSAIKASPARARIDGAIEELSDAMRDLRSYVMNLRPVRLGDDLEESLESLARQFHAMTGIPATVRVDGEPPASLRSEQASSVFHVVQEALNNIRKHAAAEAVRITLSTSDGALCVEIRDDGDGFDTESTPPSANLGLRSMAHRTEANGGQLTISSVPGDGTTVAIAIPLDR